MIQGAPGAGKSVLLYECAERAKKGGWEVEKAATMTEAMTEARNVSMNMVEYL